MQDSPVIFDRNRLRAHRKRAARGNCDFLLREMAERLSDRLLDIKRDFKIALDLGAHHGLMAEYLKVETLIQADLSPALISRAKGMRVAADEEFLPFGENIFDLVVSCGSLHWVNDLPGALIQIQRSLKPDGLFLAMLPGAETLKELRQSFEQAEMAASGGISPRISPFVDARDAGNLLTRAGFALAVADSEKLTVNYDHPLKLMHDLRNMGESNAMIQSRKNFTPCSTLMLAVDHYLREFSGEEGRINATFEFVTLTGWKPHVSQQKPLTRGSGKTHLGDALR